METDSSILGTKKEGIFVKRFKSMLSVKDKEDPEGRGDEDNLRETDRNTTRSSSSLSIRTNSTYNPRQYFGLSPERKSSDSNNNSDFDVFMEADDDNGKLPTFAKNIKLKKPLPPDDKIIASALSSALGCIADKNYDRFLQIVKNNPSVLRLEVVKSSSKVKGCNGGTLLHVLVSQQPKIKKKARGFPQKSTEIQVYPSVPERVVISVIKQFSQALEMIDNEGRLPIHCACYALAMHIEKVSKLYRNANKSYDEQGINFKVMESNLVCLLLRYNKTCAQVADAEGYLPLHYAAAMAPDYIGNATTTMHKSVKFGEPSALYTMQKLLLAHPNGINAANKKGTHPLHLAILMATPVNLACSKLLIQQHLALEHPLTDRDNNGDSPLFIALKNDAPQEVILCFIDSKGKSANLFIQRDSENNNALHIVLQAKYPNIELIKTILDIAPFTAASPNSVGTMPIRDAIKLRLDAKVICDMLARDMPIDIGVETSSTAMPLQYKRISSLKNKIKRRFDGRIVRRSHHHSWWFVLVNCKDYYSEMVYKFLSEEATHFQIVALARQIGPDGKSILINCVSEKCRLMFHALLRFYDRYEILLSTNEMRLCYEDRSKGVETFLALDHGPMVPLSEGSFSDAIINASSHGSAVKVQHNSCTSFDVEVSMLPKDKSKVLLRTYSFEEAFYAELKVRENYFFDPALFEEVYNHHKDENFTHLMLSKTDKLCCITFERPDHTLADVFSSLSGGGTRSAKWAEKSWVVLKQIAKAIQALHDNNLVHGHLDPVNICKYGNTWKIAKLGTVQKVGVFMRGSFRASVPPEAIKITKSKQKWTLRVSQNANKETNKSKSSRVQFSPRVLTAGKERRSKRSTIVSSSPSSYSDIHSNIFESACFTCDTNRGTFSEELQEEERTPADQNPTSTFCPGAVQASVAWDMWGFGLIMTHILLGRCLHLTNFETPKDAVMKKLQLYDDNVLQAICDQLCGTVGKEATDIVYLLLQKDPAKRPKSMQEILKYPYFEKLNIYV